MNISLYEFFLILIMGQCIFLIFAIQYIPKKNTGTSRIIQYLLGIYSFYLLERVLESEIGNYVADEYYYFFNIFYLLIGPLVYTYIRRLLFYENDKYHLNYYHYLPVVFYGIYGVFHINLYDSIENLSNYSTTLFFSVEVLFFISITAYLIKSYILFNYYKKNEIKELSFSPNSIKYIQLTLSCLALYMLFWLLGIFEIFGIITWIKRPVIYDISCLIFGVQIYLVSFYNLKFPEIFKIPYPSEDKKSNNKRNKLHEDEIREIQNLVKAYFEVEKGYRRSDLSLSILANEINTTTNKLSWVLNNIFGKTFYALVNEYRVENFLQRINQNKHKELTLIAIAVEVGFNSKSTFYKAFKEITKMTPSEYIKKTQHTNRSDESE